MRLNPLPGEFVIQNPTGVRGDQIVQIDHRGPILEEGAALSVAGDETPAGHLPARVDAAGLAGNRSRSGIVAFRSAKGHRKGNQMKPNRMRTFLCGLCLPVVATGVFALGAEKESTEKAAEKPADSAIRKFDLKTIAALGQQIFEQDGYASRATDIVLDKVGGPEVLTRQKIGGWVVVKRRHLVVVRFAKREGGRWTPAYDVAFDSAKHGVFKAAEDKNTPRTNWLSSKPGRSRSAAFRSSILRVQHGDPAGPGWKRISGLRARGHHRPEQDHRGRTLPLLDFGDRREGFEDRPAVQVVLGHRQEKNSPRQPRKRSRSPSATSSPISSANFRWRPTCFSACSTKCRSS